MKHSIFTNFMEQEQPSYKIFKQIFRNWYIVKLRYTIIFS